MYYLDKNSNPYYNPSKKVIEDNELESCSESEFTVAIDAVNNPELTTGQKIQQLESERDRLLKGTDWYAVRMLENGTDIPADISSYRELLRTIDQMEGYPDIELPEQPDGIKFVY